MGDVVTVVVAVAPSAILLVVGLAYRLGFEHGRAASHTEDDPLVRLRRLVVEGKVTVNEARAALEVEAPFLPLDQTAAPIDCDGRRPPTDPGMGTN